MFIIYTLDYKITYKFKHYLNIGNNEFKHFILFTINKSYLFVQEIYFKNVLTVMLFLFTNFFFK